MRHSYRYGGLPLVYYHNAETSEATHLCQRMPQGFCGPLPPIKPLYNIDRNYNHICAIYELRSPHALDMMTRFALYGYIFAINTVPVLLAVHLLKGKHKLPKQLVHQLSPITD
jgi:hypothetical protein